MAMMQKQNSPFEFDWLRHKWKKDKELESRLKNDLAAQSMASKMVEAEVYKWKVKMM